MFLLPLFPTAFQCLWKMNFTQFEFMCNSFKLERKDTLKFTLWIMILTSSFEIFHKIFFLICSYNQKNTKVFFFNCENGNRKNIFFGIIYKIEKIE